MKVFKIKKLLQNHGWIDNVFVSVNNDGVIQSIEQGSALKADFHIDDFVLPGFQNAHSHAFQYAMVGLAETYSSHNADNFWTWREAMYRLSLSLNPDEVEIIATMLYAEMVRNGYTNVAEFHYLHHNLDGNQYNNLSEIGERLINAAQKVNINITLVPIFYKNGGFGQPSNNEQKRFISKNLDVYLKLLEASKSSCNFYNGANIGIGIHSLRAVDASEVIEVSKIEASLPFHIHVSEQLKEVEECISYLGKRPVEFLLENIHLNNRFHLVHATHLLKQETTDLAKSGANVVLCPTTEGSLGDGLFPFQLYKENQGNWSIGTDSHVGISPFEELRLLDYGQRLTTHQRNTFISESYLDAGMFALHHAILSGRKAMGNHSEAYFNVGDTFNAAVIDSNSPLLACTGDKFLTSTILFSGNISTVKSTIVNGNLTQNSTNDNYLKIKNEFINLMKRLKTRF